MLSSISSKLYRPRLTQKSLPHFALDICEWYAGKCITDKLTQFDENISPKRWKIREENQDLSGFFLRNYIFLEDLVFWLFVMVNLEYNESLHFCYYMYTEYITKLLRINCLPY